MLITVEKAKARLLKDAVKTGVCREPLSRAGGLVLARDVKAPVAHPLFDQSAVDGYGLRCSSSLDNPVLRVIGEIKAGDRVRQRVGSNEAIGIYTGSPVPPGVDAVVMVEHVRVSGDSIRITSNHLHPGSNIRSTGEQIKKGAVALAGGSVLTPAAVGFLASLGIDKVPVRKRARVAAIVTGNEIMSRRKGARREGMIFESNGIMLRNCLAQAGIRATISFCRDNLQALKKSIRTAMRSHDAVIITGGVSVGRYDFTRIALESLGFDIPIHGIGQKPGKPFLFGKKGKTAAFGLPGNPLSALVCYYEYVYPYLRTAMGHENAFLREWKLPLADDYLKKDDGKTHLLAASIVKGMAMIGVKQQSHMLKAISLSDAIAVFPPRKGGYKKGEKIILHLLPPR